MYLKINIKIIEISNLIKKKVHISLNKLNKTLKKKVNNYNKIQINQNLKAENSIYYLNLLKKKIR